MTESSSIRVGIFDCDGTLVDSQGAIVLCLGHAFETFGLEAPASRSVRQIVGLGLEDAIGRLLPPGCEELIDDVTAAYRTKAYEHRENDGVLEPLYPGAREVVEALTADGWLLGIATSKSLRGVKSVMEQHGLAECFVTMQTPDHAPAKPNPEMLFRVLSDTGINATRAVMIGDTTFDMEMAAAAGVPSIGVAWGYHEVDDLRAAGAQSIVDEFGQLPAAMGLIVGG